MIARKENLMKTRFWMFIGVMSTGLWSVSPSLGVEYTWNGGTGDWGTASNWTPTGIPGNGDVAVINNGTVSGLSGTYSNFNLKLHGGELHCNNLLFFSDNIIEITGGNLYYQTRQTLFLQNSSMSIRGGAYCEFDITNGCQLEMLESTLTISGSVVKASTLNQSSNFLLRFLQDSSYGLGTLDLISRSYIDEGTVAVDVEGIHYANSNTVYTLIDCPMSKDWSSVSSNLYSLNTENGLFASLKSDLPSAGSLGSLKLAGDSLTLCSNLEGEEFNLLFSWLDKRNEDMNIQKANSSSLVISLSGIADVDSLIWDLSAFNEQYNTNAILYQAPSHSVPEPSTWLLLLLGISSIPLLSFYDRAFCTLNIATRWFLQPFLKG